MPPKRTLAAALARLMADRGLSAAELARRSGLTHDAVSHYLAGRRNPSLTAFRMLCRGLGVAVEELVAQLAPLKAVKYVPVRGRGRPKKPVE